MTPPSTCIEKERHATSGHAPGLLADIGSIPMPVAPEAFGKFIADGTAKRAKL